MTLSTTRKNVIANYAGKSFSAVLAFVVPPLLIKLLGIEAYGLTGLYATMLSIIAVLDLGLTTILQRELARSSAASDEDRAHTRDFARTIEVIFWIIGATVASSLALGAPCLVRNWISSEGTPDDMIVRSLRLMSLSLLFQWPAGVYLGGILGLQRQVLANVIASLAAVFRAIGGLFCVWAISSTLECLLIWYIIAAIAQVLVTRTVFWKIVPRAPGDVAQFRLATLKRNWRISAGMWAVGLVSIAIIQLDKVAATKLLTLNELGYYTLAGTLGTAMNSLIGPVFSAVFPRLCELVNANDQERVRALYHSSCQLMSVIILPAVVTIVLARKSLLMAWTGDARIVAEAAAPAAILAFGTAMNGLMNIPYALQLAHGWTTVSLYYGLISLPLMLVAVNPLASTWGAAGLACVWAFSNTGYVIFGTFVMHRRLLTSDAGRWFKVDVGLPLLGALIGGALATLGTGDGLSRMAAFLRVASVGSLSLLFSLACTPSTRDFGKRHAAQTWRRVRARLGA